MRGWETEVGEEGAYIWISQSIAGVEHLTRVCACHGFENLNSCRMAVERNKEWWAQWVPGYGKTVLFNGPTGALRGTQASFVVYGITCVTTGRSGEMVDGLVCCGGDVGHRENCGMDPEGPSLLRNVFWSWAEHRILSGPGDAVVRDSTEWSQTFVRSLDRTGSFCTLRMCCGSLPDVPHYTTCVLVHPPPPGPTPPEPKCPGCEKRESICSSSYSSCVGRMVVRMDGRRTGALWEKYERATHTVRVGGPKADASSLWWAKDLTPPPRTRAVLMVDDNSEPV